MPDKMDNPVNRRRFVKALGAAGGAALAGNTLASSAAASSSPLNGESEKVTGDELLDLAQSVAKKDDVVNVMGDTLSEAVQNARFVEESLENGTPQYKLETEGKEIVVDAAIHEFEEEQNQTTNEMTAVAFGMDNNHVIGHYEFENVHDGVVTKAASYDIVVDSEGEMSKLSLQELSINGDEPRPVSEAAQMTDVERGGGDDCDTCHGCHGAPPGGWNGEYLDATCSGVDTDCVELRCGVCVAACFGGPKVCAVCLIVSCGILSARHCCDSISEYCATCATGTNPNC